MHIFYFIFVQYSCNFQYFILGWPTLVLAIGPSIRVTGFAQGAHYMYMYMYMYIMCAPLEARTKLTPVHVHTVEYVSSAHGRGTLGCSGRGGWALNA